MSEASGQDAGFMLDELKDFDEIAIYSFYSTCRLTCGYVNGFGGIV